MRTRLLTLAILSTAAHSLLAQDVPVGARVRVRASVALTAARPSGGDVTLSRPMAPLTGDVVASDADTLTLRLSGRDVRVAIPRDAVRLLEVSQGRRPNSRLRGAGVGLGIGAATGALLGFAAGDDKCPPGRPNEGFFGWNGCLALFSAGDKAVIGGVALGALGGLVGAAVGAERAERWKDVTNGSRNLTLGVRPVGRRGLALTLGF